MNALYMDDDMILLKPHAKFLNMSTLVIGEESQASLANGFMMSEPKNKVFLRWLQEYKHYKNVLMGPFSVMKVWALWRKFPDEFHVEHSTMIRPNWLEQQLMFGGGINWQGSWNMHISSRYFVRHQTEVHGFHRISDIDCLDNTLGEVARLTFYGDWHMCGIEFYTWEEKFLEGKKLQEQWNKENGDGSVNFTNKLGFH